MSDLDNLLREGIAAVKSGQRPKARALLLEVVRLRPNDVTVWLWLSGAVETDGERRECLEQVLEIDPENPHALKGLQTLPPRAASLQEISSLSSVVADAAVRTEPEPVTMAKPETPQGKATARCPHCGATLQGESKFCASCGADLTARAGTKTSVQLSAVSSSDLLEKKVKHFTKQGWKIINRTETAVQFEKKKRWSQTGFVLLVLLPALGGCIFPGLWGVSVIGLLVVVLDYVVKKDKTKYITAKELEGKRQRIEQRRERAENMVERLSEDIRSLGIPKVAWAIGGVIGAAIVIIFSVVWYSFDATPVSHEAPVPTMTYPPTWTPTPRATATPTPGLRTEEIGYWVEADKVVENYVMIWGMIQMLFEEVVDDPSRQQDEDWQKSMLLSLELVPINSDKARSLSSPEMFEALHQDLLAATSYFDQAAELASNFLNVSDSYYTDQFGEQFQKGLECLERASTEVEKHRQIVTELTCDCTGDLYDCGDFKTQSQRIACYNHCRSLGYGDIHHLDQDGDGELCEDWP